MYHMGRSWNCRSSAKKPKGTVGTRIKKTVAFIAVGMTFVFLIPFSAKNDDAAFQGTGAYFNDTASASISFHFKINQKVNQVNSQGTSAPSASSANSQAESSKQNSGTGPLSNSGNAPAQSSQEQKTNTEINTVNLNSAAGSSAAATDSAQSGKES